MTERQVCPNPPSKLDVSAALAVGWARAKRTAGKGAMADAIGVDTKTIDRALTGDTVPQLHTALASLLIDDSALDEVLALYGRGRAPLLEAKPANDMATVSSLSGLVSRFCEALEDGHRDHQETLALADMIRALQPVLTDIVDQADRLRGARPEAAN